MLAFLRTHWLSLLAGIGITAGLVVNVLAQPAPTAVPEAPATVDASRTRPPFADYVAGAGIIETADRDIRVAAPVAAVVGEVHVAVGDRVSKGAPLFTLDRATTRTEVATRDAAVASARAQLAERRVSLEESMQELQLLESIDDVRATSAEELLNRRSAVAVAQARVRSAEADVRMREDEGRAARAADAQRIVRAPIDGEILAVGVRPGELAGSGSDAVVRMGRTDRLHVRVDIEENDAWRVVRGARARLYLRGNAAVQGDLRFEYVESYVRPKTSLTGAATERVDTRVLQVVFSLPGDALPIWVGQQVDVVVEVPPRDRKGGR